MSCTEYDTYLHAHRQSLMGRELEGEAFMRAANLLNQAKDAPQNKKLLWEALQYTSKLWTIVQADLNSPQTKMNDDLKANLLSLSLFVDRTCSEIIKKPHQRMLQGLIDVNRNIAKGLLE
ncbi:flagellar biosynthesis regulator FlaF [Terasakiella sp. A23]|uniref:flagellar biosynthesis regulator FlaF n=1 Tax=Terasakiella sp. FCG-A23 TaxID=3080561 RepID=UPI002954F106|nr:flagellar biosynthesis regulator FlaF [Terasakiella sp. A23]MDV7341836.1 flagellar biosynthesis regulator FlaF [Terasakiella sp. A23]